MPRTPAMAQPINHEAPDFAPARHGPMQDGDVREALARIADIIVESGEGLTLDSLIKAFWRTWSTPEGNIVSIHEARGGTLDPLDPESALARLSERMDRLAHGFDALAGGDEALAPRRRVDGNGGTRPEAPAIETSLPDRAQFEVALKENFRIARNEVEPLSVAICSVSRIDRIVENHGLHTATRLMERIANTLSVATRGECYSARKSASEFIMLARGITVGQFRDILEQSIIDLSLRRWHDKFSNKTLGMVEMHVGIAHVFDFANPSDAMRAADLAHERAMLDQSSTVVLADRHDLDED